MFVFVFYFQGVQGDSPILAGVKLAPLALGMLVSSPLAGVAPAVSALGCVGCFVPVVIKRPLCPDSHRLPYTPVV